MREKILHISVIGSGDMARSISTRLITSGSNITIYGRDLKAAQKLQTELENNNKSNSSIDAKKIGERLVGEIVILAVPYLAVFTIIQKYSKELIGKILIDITNPIDFETFERISPPGSSGAEEIAKAAPSSTKVVKSFNTVFAGVLGKGNTSGKPIDIFVASDHSQAKEIISNLIEASGMRALDAGGLQNARTLEALQLIHIMLQKQLHSNWMSAIQILD